MQAPTTASRLHRKFQHPYYVYAPDYRESSAGIQCLHYLCHALNLEGAKAYMVGCTKVHPELHTPLLTDEVHARHENLGIAPIAVYPEVVTGNPLSAPVCVRYLLNREGAMNGNRMEAGPHDLRFYFREEFYDDQAPGDYLYLPMIDIGLFAPTPVQRRTLNLLYLNRVPKEAVDFSRLPAGTQILSMEQPRSHAELAHLLRRARVLYSYEKSATCSLAVFCGCPVVALQAPGYESYANTPDTLRDLGGGIVWSDDEAALERARSEVDRVRAKYMGAEERFWPQLQNFLEKTQCRASQVHVQPRLQTATLQAWQESRRPDGPRLERIGEHLSAQGGGPTFCVVIRDRNASRQALEATIASLLPPHALYQRLALHVLTPLAGEDAALPEHPGLRLHAGVPPDRFAPLCNEIASAAGQEWLIFVDAGGRFEPAGLLVVAAELTGAQDYSAVYADAIMGDGHRSLDPMLRPAFNLDMLLSCPASMCRHWMFRREVFLQMDGFDTASGDAEEFDLLLRLVNARGIGDLGHVDEPLLMVPPLALETRPAEVEALRRHLLARGYAHTRIDTSQPGRYRIDYGHAHTPLVSIAIPVRDDLALLQRCVESLLEKTAYPHFELLLVDDGSTDEATRLWLAQLEGLGSERVRVFRSPQAPHRSAAMHVAARHAAGEYLVMLRHDTAVLQGSWLEGLLNHAQRPEVGIVGAKLLDADGRVQHAGLVLGLNGPAGSPFQGVHSSDPGYMHRLEIDQNYSAVSGDCLIVRTALYHELGGLDAAHHPSLLWHLDLCLRTRQAGYLVVWTPRVVLLRSGGDGPERAADDAPLPAADIQKEEEHFYRNWLPIAARDPAYNRNLTLQGRGFEVETDPSVGRRPLAWHPHPVVLALAADLSGCGHYRVIEPVRSMNASGMADARVSQRYFTPEELERLAPDTMLLQRQVTPEQLRLIQRTQRLRPTFMVAELDDYLPNLPLKNTHRQEIPRDVLQQLRRSIGMMDRFVVSTEPLAEALKGLHPDTRVVQNRLPPRWWSGLQASRRTGARLRVGWAGGISHQGDLELIADVVKELHREVDWIFFGMCPDRIKPYVREYHGPVPIERYPAMLASLNLDLALAPLEQNLFNECKSNLRLLEYGACGYPVIASDAQPYRCGLPVTLVKNRFKDWVDAIRAHVQDPDAAARSGDALKAAVARDWMLEGAHLDGWLRAWLPG